MRHYSASPLQFEPEGMKSEGVLLALRQAVAITGGLRGQRAIPRRRTESLFPLFLICDRHLVFRGA